MGDQIDAAVAKSAAAAAPAPVKLPVRLPTGRIVGLVVPADLSPGEAMSLIAFVAVTLPEELAKRQVQSRILVPAARA